MFSPINLTEYRMRHPDTAEFPTLSQSGALAVLLQRQRFKAVGRAHQQAKRQARHQGLHTWLKHWRAKLRRSVAHLARPTLARVVRQP